MIRRDFVTLLGAATAWPFAVRAQLERIRRIGVLMSNAESDDEGQSGVAAFRDELQKVEWTEPSQHRNQHALGGDGCRVDATVREGIGRTST